MKSDFRKGKAVGGEVGGVVEGHHIESMGLS